MGRSGSRSAGRRRWPALAARVGRLLLRQPQRTSDLVRRSYDRIAGGYDEAWTRHMQPLTLEMLRRLAPPAGAECIDLACGTGFVASALAARTGGRVIGVDSSAGMLAAARKACGGRCEFVQAGALAYLRRLPRRSADVVTCAWGLGYTQPLAVVAQIGRVLRPGGRVGIIDNTLVSLAGVLWSAVLTFAERPAALSHVTKFRFLPHSCILAAAMRLCSIGVRAAWDGAKTYYARDGADAMARLTATGAAAGFEFAADDGSRQAVFDRFAEVIEDRCAAAGGVPITHRYLAAIGEKTC